MGPPRGDLRTADRLLPLVYAELRKLAGHYMRREAAGHSLRPTELVHEAYLRLADVTRIDWQGRTHFLAIAATQMRRVLVEHARAAARKKRGARPVRVTLDEGMALSRELSLDLLALDEALERLARRNRRQGQVAELRVIAGMTSPEIAAALDVPERTVREDWTIARAWLSRWLRRDPEKPV